MDVEQNYSLDFAAAPLDEELIFIVPTGDEENPYLVSTGHWDEENMKWDGDWRAYDEPFANNDPVAWAYVPELDDEVLEALGIDPSGEDDGVEDAA